MHVEIVEKKVEVSEFTNRETGEIRKMTKQQAFLHLEDQPYPVPFVLSLDEGSEGYDKGDYQFSASSFSTDKYGKLGFAFNIQLKPASVASKLKAAS